MLEREIRDRMRKPRSGDWGSMGAGDGGGGKMVLVGANSLTRGAEGTSSSVFRQYSMI